MSDNDREDRVALVTGGLRGLGRAMALGLAREGHRVLAVGHIESDVPEMEAEAERRSSADSFHPLVADLRDAAECDRVVAATRERFGKVDILVNNAGLTFTYIDPARFRRPTPATFLAGRRRDHRKCHHHQLPRRRPAGAPRRAGDGRGAAGAASST